MKKKFDLIDLDCANCANKMEAAISEIEGVIAVSVNFMTQKIILEAEDDRFDNILKEVVKICKEIEPMCEIVIE